MRDLGVNGGLFKKLGIVRIALQFWLVLRKLAFHICEWCQ
jgi:hypothetical protein